MRRLDGWTPKRETLHHYDQQGRLVRSVEWVEPEWDNQQAAWMLALAAWEKTRCPVCGGDRDECWAIENDDGFKASLLARCHRETALAKARKDYQENPTPHALVFKAELKTR